MARWSPIIEAADNRKVRARALASAESGWFDGHFPEVPILPGVALLALVEETVRTWTIDVPEPRSIRQLRRVRFRSPVAPGTVLLLEIRSKTETEPGSQWAQSPAPLPNPETKCAPDGKTTTDSQSDAERSYDFTVEAGGQTVCTGTFLL